jgi:hypothetical protein
MFRCSLFTVKLMEKGIKELQSVVLSKGSPLQIGEDESIRRFERRRAPLVRAR